MAKRNNKNGLPKSKYPKDLRRITNLYGKRVWVTGGKEYASMAEVRAALGL